MYLCGSLCCQGSSRITALPAAGEHTHTHSTWLPTSPPSLPFPLQLSTLPLSVTSKLFQIFELYQLKSAGNVSMLMWTLSAYGCAGEHGAAHVCVLHTYYLQLCLSSARLVTVLVEVKDPMSKYTLSTCYDCTLVR